MAALVGFHVWVGYAVVAVAERRGVRQTPDRVAGPLLVLVAVILVILTLVLAKPELGELPMPGWLREPRGQPLPFDVPRR